MVSALGTGLCNGDKVDLLPVVDNDEYVDRMLDQLWTAGWRTLSPFFAVLRFFFMLDVR